MDEICVEDNALQVENNAKNQNEIDFLNALLVVYKCAGLDNSQA